MWDPNTSGQFAWLPSDFAIDSAGRVSVLSYINNLHPQLHGPLYETIARVFERFVPMLERVLTDLRHPRMERVPVGELYDRADEAKWEEREGGCA